MNVKLEELLSPRITKHCMPLYVDGHYKHAAHEAMTQVELALKEKGQVKDKRFGYTLVESLFQAGGKGQYIRLRVPLGQDLQSKAEQLFKGAFSYYRNYSAHDGSRIGQRQCLRIMILASELLDLIDASSLTFADIGGVDGLIKTGAFTSREQLLGLLKLLDGYYVVDEAFDGLYEAMFEQLGVDDLQLQAVLELDLARYEETNYVPSAEELRVAWVTFDPPQIIGWFILTDLGKQFVDAIEQPTA